jgi:N-acetylneuraminate synthase
LTDHDISIARWGAPDPFDGHVDHGPNPHLGQAAGEKDLIVCHATSTYPCDPDELNLRMIQTLRQSFNTPVGYSGHEVGLIPSVVAVAMGACMVERHITLDRAMWGSDQAASVEPGGVERLIKYVRVTEQSLGDGIKRA